MLQSHRRFDWKMWRSFHCACVRDIWPYVEDERSRGAVEIAELYLAGLSSEPDVLGGFTSATQAADEAWQIVQSLRGPGEENEWQWAVSERIDEAWGRDRALVPQRTACCSLTKLSNDNRSLSAACVRPLAQCEA